MAPSAEDEIVGLVGDIGGTNARFGIARVDGHGVRVSQVQVLHAAQFPRGPDAVAAYLASLRGPAPQFAVLAAAGPITRGAVEFTNNRRWKFSETGLMRSANLKGVRLINDFTAQALALPHLRPKGLHLIGPRGAPGRDGSAVVMGPGTGFGAAAMAQDAQGQAVVTGEGGHTNFAPGDDVEMEILTRLSRRFDHVSIERVLSGPGLLNLYQTLAEMGGEAAPLTEPAAVTQAAQAGDALARRALDRFCAILGSVAGDFALAFGAKRGVYISGGIAPGILSVLDASAFRRRFEDKDRMSDYLKPIPTRVVLDPHAALIGAATQLWSLVR